MYKLAILSRDFDQYKQFILRGPDTKLELIYADNQPRHIDELAKAAIILGDPGLVASVLKNCDSLKWLQSTWAGLGPVLAVDKTDYQLSGVKEVFGPQMSEFVFAYLLYFSRQIKKLHHLQQDANWSQPKLTSLNSSRLGIMGVGSIGKHIARTAKSFGMHVSGLTHSSRDCEFVDQYFELEQITLFAQDLDYLVCLLPNTPHTYRLVNHTFISELPDHCVFINAGRGEVVDDDALIDALHNNKIKAAVLDVFDQEPLPRNNPYWSTPNVYITQHTAAISQPQDIINVFFENLIKYENNQKLNFAVDWKKGY